MSQLKQFGIFWYDFVVGDDPILAIGTVAAILVGLALHAGGINPWWAILAIAAATLVASLMRATAKK